MEQYPKPKVVVSKCLGFAACRFNGQTISDEFAGKLGKWVEYAPVCPEVEIGLGIPREAVRLVEQKGRLALLQPGTGRDATAPMRQFCREYLGSLGEVDGFLLKSRSPSCGPVDVKIYSSTAKGASSRRGAGMFGAAVAEYHPNAAVEHEGRVKNFQIREHFLTKLFTLARFRQARGQGGMAALTDFHARHKLLFMAYNQTGMRELGRIAANPERLALPEVFALYAQALDRVLIQGARRPSNINALMHGAGYFKKQIGAAEKALFNQMLERYRAGKIPLSALQALVRSYIVRFDEKYLDSQVYFSPYPEDLVEISDSGKGRDY